MKQAKNNQIKSKQRVKDFAEVFTNEREVKAMCAAIHYKSEDPRYKMEVREYTLPHPVKDLKGFDDPNSNTYDETIDVGKVFGFYNYEEVE